MLDHVIVTVSDFTRSIAFYAPALKPLGITDLLDYKGEDGHPDLKGFGNDGRFFFWFNEGGAQCGCRSLWLCRQKPCRGERLLFGRNCRRRP
jgi:catechol 2,3-dioxygenase-like lactoylglutathione lyase family enzyme